MCPAACKAGLRIRLLAKQVFVTGWEKVPTFHRLIEVGHEHKDLVKFRHSRSCLNATTGVCASTVGGPRTNHALHRPLDARTQFLEFVWRNKCAFLQAPVSSLSHA